jgi:superfamily II DNA or RNA helicase
MLATVRNRRAIIASVEQFDTSSDGRLHLVRLEYTDPDGQPEDSLIWEREASATVLEPTALPNIDTEPPMEPQEFDALQRATRWSAITPFLTPDGTAAHKRPPIASPFFGAVQTEEFQLVPLIEALKMPRISLLLADDVGLGKTIEAGLILTELIMHRRVRKVLVLSPAALRYQWQQEMKTKFSLSFDVVDRPETHALKKRLGLDANPWRTYQRIISSYHYLKQSDILEEFLGASRSSVTGFQLPWDLLIVDEAHNLMPSNFGDDSDLCRMLRTIAPLFEHRLFLTATPHNGYTRCFSGLLELLDPIRFVQTSELTESDKNRIGQVVIRRLKSEINDFDEKNKRVPRFANRYPEPVPLFFGPNEQSLSSAFELFRMAVKKAISASSKGEQLAGSFAVEVLNKRLLSCPFTFANSWFRFKEGLTVGTETAALEVAAAQRAAEEDLADDREVEIRYEHASRVAGAWFRRLGDSMAEEVHAVDTVLSNLGLQPCEDEKIITPVEDERWERLVRLIDKEIRNNNRWKNDERLVVFTEYKTTLNYLVFRLKQKYKDEKAIKVLYGGMDEQEREDIKAAFNDPGDAVRILVATDAASEGLNLQETARFLLHYDIPWNPSRLDQRNGRLDRHGQARDVFIYHFTSDDNADIRFLAHVVRKVNEIREDLGSMGEIFDAAFERRFANFEETNQILGNLDKNIDKRKNQTTVPRSANAEVLSGMSLSEASKEIDLSPESLHQTLQVAMRLGGRPDPLEPPDEKGRVKLNLPLAKRWDMVVNDHLRLKSRKETVGRLPGIVFDPSFFIENINGRPVFRNVKDTVLLHLGHPLFRQAMSLFARARFPGGNESIKPSRWAVRYGPVPEGADVVLYLTIEELAVNELREPFHHWVRTLRIPICKGLLRPALPHCSPQDDVPVSSPVDAMSIEKVRELWTDVERDMRRITAEHGKRLTELIERELKAARETALNEQKAAFTQRINEVKQAQSRITLQKLEKERDNLISDLQQYSLFPETKRDKEIRLIDLEQELARRQVQYTELLEFLKKEQKRVIEGVIPQRHTLRGSVQVFPVTVEVRLPEVRRG